MTHTPVRAPESVEQVIERMRAIDAELHPRDGIACFNRTYLRVTELVGRDIADGFFADPDFVARLAVVLAGPYFTAVDAARARTRPPVPWKPLFDARHDRTIWPVQYALAGANAHIAHDLPLAVTTTCRERGTTPATPPVHADYLRVNELLAEAGAEVRAEFEPRLRKLATADAERLRHVVSGFDISRARDVAWGTTLTLWQQRDLKPLHNTTLATVAHEAAIAGSLLLTPVAPPPA
ncbi:DUF5995 family protein [Saccharothrix obliqua]|uniref:DUF5995 family protein n=1 Tax=Saccharothrix obliqua TaxID=2861747 RepID=UPI001C5E2F58|nr:DUF5995 family protein [Saccharothrix obliqua]MBW4717125.1 hypothetical protein [Saccharothrix obliqua]